MSVFHELDSDAEPVERFGARSGVELLRDGLDAAAWLAAAFLALVATLRIVAHDASLTLIWLNTFTLYLYLPVYLVLAWSVVRRKRHLATMSGLVTVCHLFWVAPDAVDSMASPGHSELERNVQPGRPLRLASANLLMVNRDPDANVAELQAHEPDVILLQEYTSNARGALQAAGLREAYPFRIEIPARHSFGAAVLSKLPFEFQRVHWVAETPFPEVGVLYRGRQLRLFNVHTLPPRNGDYARQWAQQLDWLLMAAGRRRMPIVLAGDFNLTQHARAHERLLDAGLSSAHEQLDRGFATTFPNGLFPLPPVRLDHVLLSGELQAKSVIEGVGPGSDHRPVFAEISWRANDLERPITRDAR